MTSISHHIHLTKTTDQGTIDQIRTLKTSHETITINKRHIITQEAQQEKEVSVINRAATEIPIIMAIPEPQADHKTETNNKQEKPLHILPQRRVAAAAVAVQRAIQRVEAAPRVEVQRVEAQRALHHPASQSKIHGNTFKI